MPDQTYAARLRERTRSFRDMAQSVADAFEVPMVYVGKPPGVHITATEADAIADVLEAAVHEEQITCCGTTREQKWDEESGEWLPCGNCPPCRQRIALAALDRLAEKS